MTEMFYGAEKFNKSLRHDYKTPDSGIKRGWEPHNVLPQNTSQMFDESGFQFEDSNGNSRLPWGFKDFGEGQVGHI